MNVYCYFRFKFKVYEKVEYVLTDPTIGILGAANCVKNKRYIHRIYSN